jgi:Cu/Ag efflux pump CusA
VVVVLPAVRSELTLVIGGVKAGSGEPAASAVDVEAEVSRVMEKELNTIEQVWRVTLDRDKLEWFGLAPGEVSQRLVGFNANQPIGLLMTAESQFLFKRTGQFERLTDVAGIVVAHQSEGDVHLGDVAEIRRGVEHVAGEEARLHAFNDGDDTAGGHRGEESNAQNDNIVCPKT